MYGKLSLQQAPPLSVPARFFLTAPVFGALAALILLHAGEAALASRWTPALLAITHCLTLGFFTSVMIGATQQLLPVLIGSVISRPRLAATVIHLLWLPGICLLVLGFMDFKTVYFFPAIFLVGSAITIYTAVILHALYKGISANESVPGIRLAVTALFITMVLGILLILGYAGVIPLWRPALTNLHLSWGLIGWISLLIMMIAWQVVPMFQITRSYPAPLRRLALPVAAALLVLKSLTIWAGAAGPAATLNLLVDTGLAAGLLVFAVATLQLQTVSRRKIRDSHRDYWRLAMLNLILALAFWIGAVVTGRPAFGLLSGTIFLLGFAMAAVTGMLLKIISFLIWLHLTAINDALRAGSKPGFNVPKMKRVISDRKSDALLYSLIAAELTVCGAILYPAWLTVPAALIWLLFFILLGGVLAQAVYRYYRSVSVMTRDA